MATLPESITKVSDILLVKLAREIAIDHFDIETILNNAKITPQTWEVIKTLPRFQALLTSEIRDWQGAGNTHERTKLKAAAVIEEWLPNASAELYKELAPLPARVELAKLVARIAEMGVTGMGVGGGGGERFTVTINLGADNQLKIEKQLTPTTIDAEPISNA